MCKKYFLSYLLHMQRYSLFCLFENKNRCFLPKNDEKRKNFHFFQQKKGENIFFTEKSCTFASQLSLGLWCNGNTADSGPAFPGSSPGSPTERFPFGNLFFVYFLSYPVNWKTALQQKFGECIRKSRFRSVEIYCGFRLPLYSMAVINLNCSLIFSLSLFIISFGRPKGPKGPARGKM